MPTYILLEEVKKERIKYVQSIIENNYHIKTVKEVFKNENNQIEVDFDCEHSRDAAMDRIKRKEDEWLKLIPEEEKNKSQATEQQEEYNTRKRKKGSIKQTRPKQDEKPTEKETKVLFFTSTIKHS